MLLLPLSCLLVALNARAEPVHVPIVRRSLEGRIDWADAAENLRGKYHYPSFNYSSTVKRRLERRQSSAGFQMIDQNRDASYFAPVDIGNPPQTLNVILDTGSADLWVVDTSCQTCSSSTPVFDTSASSSLQTASGAGSETQIQYGSGAVAGTLSQDRVSMGSFTIDEQTFLAVDQTTTNLLSGSVSGIMGLAYEAIASTGSTPFWQGLANGGELSAPEMSFWMDRYRGDASASPEEPGGIFTLGGTNSSLFTGDIEFLDLPVRTPSFWLLAMTSLTVQGESIELSSGTTSLAAIDTGTTLIGGPSEDVARFWDAIDGSRTAIGQPGLYSFPCDTDIEVTISFGGLSWPINPIDMSLGPERSGSDMCLGGIFDLTAGSNIPEGSGAPGWVVGATFLKNVYSVFRASDPPAIGFAQLSDAVGSSGTPGPAPSGTSTGSGSGTSQSDGAAVTLSKSTFGILSGVVALFASLL